MSEYCPSCLFYLASRYPSDCPFCRSPLDDDLPCYTDDDDDEYNSTEEECNSTAEG
jgi:hypothetical protein